jgi:predicted nucleotidyltransferase
MLQQEAMIERTCSVCREDERLAAAMMYGSFAKGDGLSGRLDRRFAETFSARGPEGS